MKPCKAIGDTPFLADIGPKPVRNVGFFGCAGGLDPYPETREQDNTLHQTGGRMAKWHRHGPEFKLQAVEQMKDCTSIKALAQE